MSVLLFSADAFTVYNFLDEIKETLWKYWDLAFLKSSWNHFILSIK